MPFPPKKEEMKCFSKCNALKFNILKFCDNLLPIFFITAMSHIRYIYTLETSQNTGTHRHRYECNKSKRDLWKFNVDCLIHSVYTTTEFN